MKISAVSKYNLSNIFPKYATKPNITINKDYSISSYGQQRYNLNINNNYFVSFKGISVHQAILSPSNLHTKYIEENQPDIIQFLSQNKTTSISAFKFLCHATTDERTAHNTAKKLSEDPRKAAEIKEKLIDILGGGTQGEALFMTWFHDEAKGYRKAYADYYNSEIWQKSESLNDIVKQSPNVSPWALEAKAHELNCEVTLGEIPEDFQDIETYRELISQIKKSDFFIANRNEKDDEANDASKNIIGNSKTENKDSKKNTMPFLVTARGRNFIVEPVVQSFSAKDIYFITPQTKNAKKYVLKFDPYIVKGKTDKVKKINESAALRPDMPYLDAMVDFYLKENQSPNAPDIKFYDHNTKSVLYEKTEGTEPKTLKLYEKNLYTFLRRPQIKDLMDLGIILSDVHSGNFKVNKAGEYKLIDSGHANFSSTFRPPVIGKHITLGNLCGRALCI